MKRYIFLCVIFSICLTTSCKKSSNSEQETTSPESETSYSDTGITENAEISETVLKQLGLKESDCYERFFVEKILPYNEELSVMVIPKTTTNENDEFLVFDSYILVVNNQTGKIINKFYEADGWVSDAVVLDNISIDTAPYRLNDETRAVGIRTRYHGSSRVCPYGGEYLSLFIPQNDGSLIRILKNYPASESHGDWDTRFTGTFEDVENVFVIGKEKTNNFNNIIVTSTIKETTMTPNEDESDSIEKETVKKSSKTLKYINGEYQ